MVYKTGFPQFVDNRLEPGLVTHAVCMEECKRRGLLKYDFLAGKAQYKEQLSNTSSSLTWATVHRGPHMWVIDKAVQLFLLIKSTYEDRRQRA